MLRSLLLLCALMLPGADIMWAQLSGIPNALSMNDAAGRDFWIAIPPSEVESHPTESLEVHLVSTQPAVVTLTDAYTGSIRRYELSANEVRTLSQARGDVSWNSEVREAEQPVPKGLHIESTTPITVYVLNSKQFTHDGYRALPTHVWGREYIPISYYDFKEFAEWAGGFVVVASERTILDILLRGVGTSVAKTSGGRDINTDQRITVSLEPGEVYMVRGDGTTRGTFDISGSLIRSDKPIGVLAFHMKTSMPNMLAGGGRQHLVEMCQPTSTWGLRTATVELTRTQSKGPGSGDVFRIMASENSTKWSVTSYNRNTKRIISRDGGNLLKGGDFADLTQSTTPTALISGVSVWESSKPCRIVQYATSWMWDYNTNLDPLMIEAPALDAGVQRATFATSPNRRFSTNHVSLIVQANPSAETYVRDLESVMIDGVAVWSHPQALIPGLKSNHIGDGIHFATIEIPSNGKPHIISCNENVRFTGTFVGSGADEAYGWPIAGSVRPRGMDDSVAPSLAVDTRDCRFASVSVNDGMGLGIAAIDTVAGAGNINIDIVREYATPLPRFGALSTADFTILVRDKQAPARCVFYVQDWADNVRIDSVSFVPVPSLDTLPPQISPELKEDRRWSYRVTEERNIPVIPEPCPTTAPQRETGIRQFMVEKASDSLNMRVKLEPMPSSDSMKPTLVMRIQIEVTDPKIDAKCRFVVRDWAGNSIVDSVRYTAPTSIESDRSDHAFRLNYRNAVISYECADERTPYRADLYSVHGQHLVSFVPYSPTGQYPTALAAGLYVLVLQYPTGHETIRLMVAE
ncbi:MAG: hypothetical protein FGM33_08760 [Candidatus Kapabacteria bacterium]|nr:hypothetical protein [Candidatus Kapabacteria bacterium]